MTRRRQPSDDTEKTIIIIEDHPSRHDWETLPPRDSVLAWRTVKRDGVAVRMPDLIKRVETCPHCPTLRWQYIAVRTWQLFMSVQYKYARNVKIKRVTREAFRKREFMRTTDLPPEVRDLLA